MLNKIRKAVSEKLGISEYPQVLNSDFYMTTSFLIWSNPDLKKLFSPEKIFTIESENEKLFCTKIENLVQSVKWSIMKRDLQKFGIQDALIVSNRLIWHEYSECSACARVTPFFNDCLLCNKEAR